VLPAVAETLDPLHKLRRDYSEAVHQRVIPQVSVYFVTDSVRKPLDTPSNGTDGADGIQILGVAAYNQSRTVDMG